MKNLKKFIIEGEMSDLDIKRQEYDDKLKSEFDIELKKYKNRLVGGVADKITTEQILEIPIDTLIKGIKVEFEHTDNPYEALEITLDHLFENPPKSYEYYNELAKMEAKL